MADKDAPPPAGKLATETAGALLKAGASVARSFAEAVSGRPQAELPGEPPLASLVRHASSGVATVARIMVDAARAGTAATGRAEASPASSQAGPAPVVTAGGTLRVPLSIDNPGDTAMEGLTPRVVETRHGGVATDPLPVRFVPETLSIGPRDFEKLVLLVDVPTGAHPGRWQIAFSVDGGPDPTSELAFDIAPA